MPTYPTPSAKETPMCDTCSKNKKNPVRVWTKVMVWLNHHLQLLLLLLLRGPAGPAHVYLYLYLLAPFGMIFNRGYFLNRCVETLGKSLSDLSTRHNEQTSHMKLSLLECRNSYLMQRKEETSCKTRVLSSKWNWLPRLCKSQTQAASQRCQLKRYSRWSKQRPSGVNSKDI